MHAVDDTDGTVCEALRRIKPDYFGNGGDRTNKNTPELDVCHELGIEPVFELGGVKYTSSSMINGLRRVTTRWGFYDVLLDMPKLKVKILNIEAGKKLSLQRHNDRSEFFYILPLPSLKGWIAFKSDKKSASLIENISSLRSYWSS